MAGMDADDLIISVSAFNKKYEDNFNPLDLSTAICSKYPHPTLSLARIKPHHLHGDSQIIDEALANLLMSRVYILELPKSWFRWNFPDSPAEYFNKNIKPALSEVELTDLEELAKSL